MSKMFWYGFITGLVLGANISLFLYAMIIAGSKADEHMNYDEGYEEFDEEDE